MGTGRLLLHYRLARVIGQAMWRQDGRALYFVSPSPALAVGASRTLFALDEDTATVTLGPGDRFLVSVLVGKRPTSLNEVQNWTAQLGKAP